MKNVYQHGTFAAVYYLDILAFFQDNIDFLNIIHVLI